MRRLLLIPLLLAGLTVGSPSHASPAAASSRILYSSDWSGPAQIHAADPSRRQATAQLTFGAAPACRRRPGVSCGFYAPEPSPDGRRVLFWDDHYLARETTLYVARADGRRRVAVARNVPKSYIEPPPVATWSPDSKRIAYRSGDWHVIGADGTQDRIVARAPSWVPEPGISPDGRWVARSAGTELTISKVGTPIVRTFRGVFGGLTWSPDSRRLAISNSEGIHVLDVRGGRITRLTPRTGSALAWSPDGLALAFVERTGDPSKDAVTGDLLVVTLSGRVRTVVDAGGDYGGHISGVVWTRPPAGLRYRDAAPRFTPASNELVLPSPVTRLAADGDGVAFAACGHVFVWRPARREVLQPEPIASMSPRCTGGGNYVALWIYSLALSEDRVVWAERAGNLGQTIWLGGAALGSGLRHFTLGQAYGAMGGAWSSAIGHATGSGSLLVFSSWHEISVNDPAYRIVTTEQRLLRVGPHGCPCPELGSSPGPFVPVDVDGGRLVVYGDNETVLLDEAGAELLSVPLSPLAAQLAGSDLVLLRRGELRHYDSGSGNLVHTWPLPDVSSGTLCGGAPRCFELPRLTLEDAARGLVSYVLDGEVHVLRLADGADAVVARGSTARFMDAGLVYADGSRLRLVPFDRLPLR